MKLKKSQCYYEQMFLVFPEHCNHHLYLIFGGAFMSQLDMVAAHCSRVTLMAGNSPAAQAVTHIVDKMEFHKPCYVGNLLKMRAQVVSMGKKSLIIDVTAHRVSRDGEELAATARMIFVTIGEIINLAEKPKFLPYMEHGLELDED